MNIAQAKLPRILLVEDEAILSIIIQDTLTPHGYCLTAFQDGSSAWQHLQATDTAYDVIILDRNLPGMDGLALLRHIKNQAAYQHTPVILETALSDKDSIREGLSQGAYYYLTKPFLPEVLLAVVNAAMQQANDMQIMLDSLRRAEQPLTMLQHGRFQFRNLEQGRVLCNYLSHACPQPERVVPGCGQACDK